MDEIYSHPSLRSLKQRLSPAQTLSVCQDGGHCWASKFVWSSPATQQDIRRTQEQLRTNLPYAYQKFLLLNNGASMFLDEQYGQWGFEIYGTANLIAKQQYWRNVYGELWYENFLVFGESLGDTDILVFDTNEFSDGVMDAAVIDGDGGYQPREWRRISHGFALWLDHLIVAQGSKYWRWT